MAELGRELLLAVVPALGDDCRPSQRRMSLELVPGFNFFLHEFSSWAVANLFFFFLPSFWSVESC